jgi:hypothetical protein
MADESELRRCDSDRAAGSRILFMAQKPVEEEVAHRFAELVGLGLTQHEAARAVGIGTRTGERLMTNSEIRQIVELTRDGDRDGDATMWALLKAVDEAGNPNLEQRAKGVELALAYLKRLADERGDRERLPGGAPLVPEGAILVLPLPE